jgi:membrane protein YdbS with pleckstrin-like domain
VKCGRAWQVTHFTVVLAVLLSAVPVIYVLFHFPSQPVQQFVALGEALAAAIAIYFLTLLFFGRLEPRRHRSWRH